MDISITGAPVRYWDQLRKPIRKSVEGFLDGKMMPYGAEVRITFFGTHGKGYRLFIAFDRGASCRVELAHLIASICQGHSQENAKWYEGFDLIEPG